MSSKNDSTIISRRRFLKTAGAGLAGLTLAACGSGGGGAAQPAGQAGGTTGGALAGATIKWSSWGNPGETQRLKEFGDDFNQRTGAKFNADAD